MIRPLSSPAITYLRPPSKFPRSFVADAVIDNMNKVQPKSQPVNPLSAPLATVCKINPKKIRRMPVPNRAEEAFLNEDFDNLCQSVRLGKGNAVPIMVRRCSLDADGTEFLLLYGERRLRACEVEGVDVDAIIAVGKEDAAGEFLLMLRENLCRAALSPVDWGVKLDTRWKKSSFPLWVDLLWRSGAANHASQGPYSLHSCLRRFSMPLLCKKTCNTAMQSL